MSDIEWQDSSEYQPPQGSIQLFCLERDIAWQAARALPGPLVFIESAALESLHEYLAHDVQREHGGVLVGQAFHDAHEQRHYLVIRAAIPAQASQGSAVHLQFTPQTWDHISGIIEESFPDQVILGWYHSHPALGVFMSGTDQATQRAFYNHPWSVAVVADPVVERTGWFHGADCRQLERACVLPFVETPEREDEEHFAGQDELRRKWLRLLWLLPLAMALVMLMVGVLWRDET